MHKKRTGQMGFHRKIPNIDICPDGVSEESHGADNRDESDSNGKTPHSTLLCLRHLRQSEPLEPSDVARACSCGNDEKSNDTPARQFCWYQRKNSLPFDGDKGVCTSRFRRFTGVDLSAVKYGAQPCVKADVSWPRVKWVAEVLGTSFPSS